MELKLNSGDVITIPNDCKAVIKDNVITVEKEEQEFKDGDFVYITNGARNLLMIYKSKKEQSYANHHAIIIYGDSLKNVIWYNGWCYFSYSRIATEEEKRFLLDRIHADGKYWDADKKQIVDYKWKPKIGETYYFISWGFDVLDNPWSYDYWDNLAYNNGNCFKTKEEAQKYADKFVKILKERKL